MPETDKYPEWSDEDWRSAKRGAPWIWEKASTREALDKILEALETSDVSAALKVARQARAELE
ncbi:MAG: hypothetical protein AAF618_09070 [Pseudomonadota bacterium]